MENEVNNNGNSKSSQVKHYLLDALENGEFELGKRLPGAKKISAELNISLATVQSAIDTLAMEGIIETVPRGGSYIQKNWRNRILHSNISRSLENRAWEKPFKSLLNKYLPEMRLTNNFPESIFEIRTTATVQAHHDEYMDLSDLFDDCYPDKSDFEMGPFKSFYFNGKLKGLPYIYSPRVMFYNPDILRSHDCPEPKSGWTWNDFIRMIKLLREKMDHKNIIYWTMEPFYFMNVVVRAGGRLINPKLHDPVLLDSEKTIYGFELIRELGKLVDLQNHHHLSNDFFIKRNMAFFIGGRDCLPTINAAGWDNWNAVELPMIPGGVDTTMQATELLCIRKNCTDLNTAKEIIKLILSREYQDMIGSVKYSIPIRKSSARKSIDHSDRRDALFMTEATKVMREYNLNSPAIYNMFAKGARMCLESKDDNRPMIKQLANALRTYIAIENNSWNKNLNQIKKENVSV